MSRKRLSKRRENELAALDKDLPLLQKKCLSVPSTRKPPVHLDLPISEFVVIAGPSYESASDIVIDSSKINSVNENVTLSEKKWYIRHKPNKLQIIIETISPRATN